MGLLEELLERLVLGLQNLELGEDLIDGGALGKKFCKAESKFKYKSIQAAKIKWRNLQYGGDIPSLVFRRVSRSWIACRSFGSFLFSLSISNFFSSTSLCISS
jgi:hypothetical protein